MIASRSWRAWSCSVRLLIDSRAVDEAVGDLEILLDETDRAASRFRSDSELVRANRNAGRPVVISRLLTGLVASALDAAEHTQGAVDPTIGLDLERWGYDRDITLLPANRGRIEPAARTANWSDVRLDRDRGLLTVPRGTALDLGATAKAATADRAAKLLGERFGRPVLVEIGGDLAVADAPEDGWVIGVAEQEGNEGQTISLRAGGIATSTTTIRRWQCGDAQAHHIIDPVTGSPTRGRWRTATVVASSALAANVASTASIVLGWPALGWLADQQLPARLVDQVGRVVTAPGWPSAPMELDRLPVMAS
jgi:thiamine biosynthesis lipoprotein